MMSKKSWLPDSHFAIVNHCLIGDTQVQATLKEWEDKVSISVIDVSHVR